MKKLLIFDLDGTLIDTLIDLKNAVNYALNLKNYPKRTSEQIRLALGHGVSNLVAKSIPNGLDNPDYDFTLLEFRKYYGVHHSDNTKPYEGIIDVLKTLKEKGYILAVATNKITTVARPLIEEMYPGIFDYIQGDEPGMNKKPDSMMIDTLCERFNVTHDEAFYIGDTEVDMQTAINSHVDYVLVTYGYRTRSELNELCKNKPMINTMGELLNRL